MRERGEVMCAQALPQVGHLENITPTSFPSGFSLVLLSHSRAAP